MKFVFRTVSTIAFIVAMYFMFVFFVTSAVNLAIEFDVIDFKQPELNQCQNNQGVNNE